VRAYNFNEEVRKALAMSREEAVRLHHAYVGTEHILLALVGNEASVACAMLRALSQDPHAVRSEIDSRVQQGRHDEITGPDLPYTTRAKKVLEQAMSEASELDHDVVGTEHLLAGLIREEQGIAAQVLREKGVTLDSARAAMRRVLGAPDASAPSASALLDGLRASRSAISIAIEVHERDGGLRHRVRFDSAGEAIAFLEAVRLARGE
jgi:ATP-dependent Clp protease ATP-binding subunit ClpC